MASEWFYFKNGQQQGPVNSARLKELAGAGELMEGDLIWKEGMGEWIAAGSVKGLFPGAGDGGTAGGGASAGAAKVDYYNPTGGFGSRAAVILRGFPPPSGNTDHWPLSEQDLLALTKAEGFRKRIRALSRMFALLLVLASIACAWLALMLVQGTMAGFRFTPLAAVIFFWAVANIVFLSFALRANKQCRLWPSVIGMILYSVYLLANLGYAVYGFTLRGDHGNEVFISLISVLFDIVVIYMCIVAYGAIPRFLKCPVWAQEALVHAKL